MLSTKAERRRLLRPTIPMLLAAIALAVAIALWLGNGNQAPIYAQGNAPPAPTGVTATDGNAPGVVIVRWNAVAGAPFYRIGWVSADDIVAVQAEGRHWLDAFAFSDVANRGQTSYTVPRLAPGQRHAFIVASVSRRFGAAAWSEWVYLTTATPAPTPAQTPTPAPTFAPVPTPTRTPDGAGAAGTERAALVALYHATDGDNWPQTPAG